MVSPRWTTADSFDTDDRETAARQPLAQPAAAGPQEIAEVPLGLFEPFSDDVGEKTAVHANVNPVAREQYRRLAATLHHVQAERGLKAILVGSALAEEGKTLTAVNIALTLSESYRRRVLLIDADLRRPTVHHAFGFDNIVGLADALAAKEERRLPIVASLAAAVRAAGRDVRAPIRWKC